MTTTDESSGHENAAHYRIYYSPALFVRHCNSLHFHSVQFFVRHWLFLHFQPTPFDHPNTKTLYQLYARIPNFHPRMYSV